MTTILITGANRGIGAALVEAALQRGATRVYAATRTPFSHPDARVVPLRFDLTEPEQIASAAETVTQLDVLINNAGVAFSDELGERELLERHLAVNLLGTFDVTQAFLPLLERSSGAIVNVLSLAALTNLPVIPAYSVSKAAALSLTQGQRALLASRGVAVHAVLTGPTDTDMSRELTVPKASPESVAHAILEGVERGEEEIFPDPASAPLAEPWRAGAVKALERQFAGFVAAPVA
jgi:NAD(P)-dependent dehydrogenase (short-subunit alcohol dehydrogenase family)